MLAFEENRPFHHIFSPLCLTMYYYSLWKLSCWQSRQKIRCRSLDKWLVQLRVNIANYWDTKAVWLPTDQFRIRPQIHRYSPIPCSLKVIKINDTPSNVLIGYRSADRQYLEDYERVKDFFLLHGSLWIFYILSKVFLYFFFK